MDTTGAVPPGADPERPSVARVYDYLLGGTHHLPADRARAEHLLRADPAARELAVQNRAFLARVVRWLAAQGVRQYLDLGSGIPASGNVHELARAADPEARVVYSDLDPVAVAEGSALLAGDPHAAFLRADVRDPAALLAHPEVARLLDLDRPVGVLLLGVLPFVPDDTEAAAVVATLRDAIAPGSYLAVSHRTTDPRVPGVRARGPEQLAALLAGLEPVPPGLVPLPRWRPDGPDQPTDDSRLYGGVVAKGE